MPVVTIKQTVEQVAFVDHSTSVPLCVDNLLVSILGLREEETRKV